MVVPGGWYWGTCIGVSGGACPVLTGSPCHSGKSGYWAVATDDLSCNGNCIQAVTLLLSIPYHNFFLKISK